jgi:hypothetical protein
LIFSFLPPFFSLDKDITEGGKKDTDIRFPLFEASPERSGCRDMAISIEPLSISILFFSLDRKETKGQEEVIGLHALPTLLRYFFRLTRHTNDNFRNEMAHMISSAALFTNQKIYGVARED